MTVTLQPSPPSVPRSVRAVARVGAVALSWAPPSSPGTSAIGGYRIYYAAERWSVDSLRRRADDTSLFDHRPAQRNHLLVQNRRVQLHALVCKVVERLSEAGCGVHVSQRHPLQYVPSHGWALLRCPGRLHRRLARPPSAATGSITCRAVERWTAVDVGPTTRSRLITGLRNGTTYWFRIAVYNSTATGLQSRRASQRRTPVAAPGPCPTPRSIPGNRTLKLTWSAPPSNGATINRYAVQVYSGGRWVTVTTLAASARSYTARNLVNGRDYWFRVVPPEAPPGWARRAVGCAELLVSSRWEAASPLSTPTTTACMTPTQWIVGAMAATT